MNSDKEIQASIEPVVLFRIDSDKAENKELSKQYQVRYLPTFALVDKNGAPIDRLVGYERDEFLSRMTDVQGDLATIDQKVARYKAGPDSKTAVALARYNAALLQYKAAVNYFRDAQNLKTDPRMDFTDEIFQSMYDGATQDTVFAFGDVARAADVALMKIKNDVTRSVDISEMMALLAQRKDRKDLAAQYLQKGLDVSANSSDPEVKRSHARLMVNFAMHIKNDTATAVEYKKLSMPEGWMDKAGQLNDFAWWCFENNTNLGEAEKLSQKSVNLAKPGKEKAMFLDTLAEIKNARGDKPAAVELTRKAIQEDPESKYYPSQLEKFQGKSKS